MRSATTSGIGTTSNQVCTDDPTVYEGVQNGCDLITCPAGTTCGIFNGIASLGNGPFEPFQFPKCVSNPLDLSRNTEQNGNVQNIVNGPGCNCGMTQCAVGFQCQVESSICDQLPACLAGTTCVTASGIAKYGNLQSAQFFWPFCA
uniref:EB domain-containing protein n=1 Tax=Globodera rostochiensis TaxID=31243 RepID=A0A914GSA7_GLORO